MEKCPEPEINPDQLVLFGIGIIATHRFQLPIVTEITNELSQHTHKITKDNFLEDL